MPALTSMSFHHALGAISDSDVALPRQPCA
jgi:hypothetical protein